MINPIIYAEVSVRFADYETCDATLSEKVFARKPFPWEGSFLAGKAFQRYKEHGGTETSSLADFYIGAHAAVAGLRLLTRDARRYRDYFPTVEVIAP